MYIDKVSFALVKGAKNSKHKNGNAKVAWDNLKTKYEPNTGSELVDINQEYISLNMENDADPEDFITDLQELREKMAEAPFNEKVSERSYMIRILNALPDKYETMIEALEKELGYGTLTVDEIKSRTRAKYKRLHRDKSTKDNAVSLVANWSNNDQQRPGMQNYNKNAGWKNNKKYKSKQFKGTCRMCSKYDHKASDCWENNNNNRNQDKFKKGGFAGKSNYCGIPGHKENECRKKTRDMQNNKCADNIAENEETVLICHDNIHEF